MLTTVIVCLCLGTNLHAGNITRSSSSTYISTSTVATLGSRISSADAISPSSLLDVDDELTKIAGVCLSHTDYEQLAGNVVRYNFALPLSFVLVYESVASIGLAELRAALILSPPHPWQSYNDTEPTETELQRASTPDEYYELREPRNSRRSLNSSYLFEDNVAAGIAYLDARLPSIRVIFRQTFEAKRPREGVIDKTVIDRMIDEYFAILNRVDQATSEMLSFRRKCRD